MRLTTPVLFVRGSFGCAVLVAALSVAVSAAAQPTEAAEATSPAASAAPPEAEAAASAEVELSRAAMAAVETAEEQGQARAARAKVAAKVQLEQENKAYDSVLSTYHTARRLFGEDHVVLTAIAFTGGRCKAGKAPWDCPRKLDYDTGVAGLIAVPLLGYGASWGWDWFPVLQTEEEAQAYERFSRQARAYQKLAYAVTPRDTKAIPDEREGSLELAFRRSVELLRQTLLQARDDDKRYFKEVGSLLGCLERLEGSTDPLSRRQAQLDAMWNEYQLLSGNLPQRRHGFLLGPAMAIQLNDPFDYLYGLSAELGRPWARLMVTGGLRATTSSLAFRPVGWYVGLGLSGELADDLVNLITGASKVASKL